MAVVVLGALRIKAESTPGAAENKVRFNRPLPG